MVARLQEDLKAFLMDNWAPALQAAFGDGWQERFAAETGCEGELPEGLLLQASSAGPSSMSLPAADRAVRSFPAGYTCAI